MPNNDENKEETVNQENQQEKTFTQEEVNKIVQDRLARQAEKFNIAAEASKAELQSATDKAKSLQAEVDGLKKDKEIRTIREQVASEKGVPATLLHGDTKEECDSQADAILAYVAGTQHYPQVKDAGETQNHTGTTRDLFAEWFNNQTK